MKNGLKYKFKSYIQHQRPKCRVQIPLSSPRKSKNSSVKQMCGYFETLNETLTEHGFLLDFQLPPALNLGVFRDMQVSDMWLAVGREYNK